MERAWNLNLGIRIKMYGNCTLSRIREKRKRKFYYRVIISSAQQSGVTRKLSHVGPSSFWRKEIAHIQWNTTWPTWRSPAWRSYHETAANFCKRKYKLHKGVAYFHWIKAKQLSLSINFYWLFSEVLDIEFLISHIKLEPRGISQFIKSLSAVYVCTHNSNKHPSYWEDIIRSEVLK